MILGDNGAIVAASENTPRFGNAAPTIITLGSITSTFFGDGGDDAITTLGGIDLIIAGIGGDIVDAGEADNVVIGDNGNIVYNLGAPGYDGATATLDLVETIEPTFKGGTDVIRTGAGDDIVLGGDDSNDASTDVTEGAVILHVSGDYLSAGDGKNVVLGDNGRVVQNSGKLLLIESTETGTGAAAQGGDDVIRTETGDDTIVAGFGNDNVKAGNGNNLVAGDSGKLTYTSAVGSLRKAETISSGDGGTDDITTGSGQDVIFGGAAGDIIDAGNGNNVVLGDNGIVDYVSSDGDTGDIDQIGSTDQIIGGSDNITTGQHNDIVLGGALGDVITAGAGDNLILGDSGLIVAAAESGPRFGNAPTTVITLGSITSTGCVDGRK